MSNTPVMDNQQKQHLHTGLVLLLIASGIALAVALFIKLTALVLIIFIAVVITTGIDPGVRWLQRLTARWWRMPRALATILLLVFAVAVLAGIAAFFLVTAINESLRFAQDTWPKLQIDLLNGIGALSQRYPFIPPPDALLQRVGAQSGQIARYLLTTTQAVFGFVGGLFSLLPVFFLTLFFTIFKDGITYTLRQFIPPRYQPEVMRISHLAGEKMGGWLRGQIILAFIITVAITLGMAIIGVPYAAMIGIIGGIGELIPMVGPYLAFVPAILIALAVGAPLWKLVLILVIFIVLTQTENFFLAPKVMERQVELPPVTTILALLIGGSLLGLVGALLAIPVAAAGRVILFEAVFPAIQGKSRAEIEAAHPEAPSPPPVAHRRGRKRTARA